MGVEPTEDIQGCPPTDLKSAEPTGTHPLPDLASKISIPNRLEQCNSPKSSMIGWNALM